MGCFCSNGQESRMELPDINENLGSLRYPYLSIRVIDSSKVTMSYNYAKDLDTIPFSMIKDAVYLNLSDDRYGLVSSLYMKTHIHLFADRNINYNIIDALKTELSATNKSRYIIYRSNMGNLKNSEIAGIKHKSPLGFLKLILPEYKKTKEETRTRDSLSRQQEKDFPHLAELSRSLENSSVEFESDYTLESVVYGLQQEIIDEYLLSKTYKCYKITNKGFKDSKKVYQLSDLGSILRNYDVVLLSHNEDLIYENYLEFIKELHKYIPNFGNKKVKAEVVELSNQIKKIHKLANIELCN
jgi:hypothetical protein